MSAGLSLLVSTILGAGPSPPGEAIPFEHIVVDFSGPGSPWGKSVGDLNGDGRPDLLVQGNDGGAELVWYENPTWTRRTLAGGGGFRTDLEVVDVDGDGDRDVVTLRAAGVVWLRNPDWSATNIGSASLHDLEVADLDGDGDVDVVARNQGGDGDVLHFWRQDGPASWHHATQTVPGGEGLALADIDGDGRQDVVVNRQWLKNPGALNDPPGWPAHTYGATWTHPAAYVATSDVNGDGRRDVVLAPSESGGSDYRLSWFEAPVNPEGPWAERVVDPAVETVHHFVGAADFDGDGATDIAAAEMHQGADPDEVKVYRNLGGGTQWEKQVLAGTGSHSMRIVDVDGDGRPDLFGANWSGGLQQVELWRNQAAAALPSVSIADVSLPEGDTGATGAVFGVSLSAAGAQPVTLAFATADGTATAGADYLAAAGAFTFPPGTVTGAITVAVVGDTTVETDETFVVSLSAPSNATIGDGAAVGTIQDDDAPPLAARELGHGSALSEDLGGSSGVAGADAFRIGQAPYASYEVAVDGASGAVQPLALERLAADNVTVVQNASPAGTGGALVLRWENTASQGVSNQHVRVRSGGCASACGPGDAYRIRAWDTTHAGPRFNNSGSQVTVLVLQNPAGAPLAGRIYFWNPAGSLIAVHPFTLGARQSLALNTAGLPSLAGQSGTMTVTHTGGYGGLAGKAVALEPASGYSFDTPLLPRPR